MSNDENNNKDPIQSKGKTTISRSVGVALSNGKHIEAPVEVWIYAILKSLPESQIELLFPIVERLNLEIKVTTLTDGMVLVHEPIVGARA